MEEIQSREQLLQKAREIESEDERINFILNYFLENVEYNYAYLFTKGYTAGTISKVSENQKIALNQLQKDGDEDFSLRVDVLEGESRIFNEILALRDSSADYEEFISQLRELVKRELTKHLDNKDLVEKNVDEVVSNIELDLRKKEQVSVTSGNETFNVLANYDISKVLIEYLLEISQSYPQEKKHFVPTYNNGLITNGVCENYTDYLVPLLNEMGIEAHSVDGTSEMRHAWVIVKVGDTYKSIDLTRAVFIRDGFIGIPKEQTSQDWLYTDIGKMFEMQSTRTIKGIDNIKLQNVLTPQNYNEQLFREEMALVSEKVEEKRQQAFKQALEDGLRDRISLSESDLARANEQTKERDVIIDE